MDNQRGRRRGRGAWQQNLRGRGNNNRGGKNSTNRMNTNKFQNESDSDIQYDYELDNENLDVDEKYSPSSKDKNRERNRKNIFDQNPSKNDISRNNANRNSRDANNANFENNGKRPYRNNQNQSIEKKSDVFRELRFKQKPNLRNVDTRIFNEIDKFNEIVYYIGNKLMGNQTTDAFFELCKVFTLPDLIYCKDINKQSSIYAIFFDTSRFKLEDVINDIVVKIVMEPNSISDENIILMFNFFKALINVSSSHSEPLSKSFLLLEKIIIFKPSMKKNVDDIKEYATQKEEDEINSLESAVSPTADDLFHSKRIDNPINGKWNSFNEYKRAMIDLTKENFYFPFRKNLNLLKEGGLDARDLFLYEDVFIAFTSNIDNYSVFKECNFFLKFKIRAPPNWKKPMRAPEWRRTEQLGNRSLLILSTSSELLKIDAVCRSCAVARSLSREQSRASIDFLNNGIVPVVLISGQIKENTNYYMFEPTSCWPAVQPILQRLLKMSEISFPSYFLNKILKLDFTKNRMEEVNKIQTDILLLDPVPNSQRPNYEKMASEKWHFDVYSDSQMDTLLRVDHEQYRALRYALCHNLTLVNGAPGTGKTHFAREYLRVMTNLKHPKPIAIITFTNHALDSILEGVLQFVPAKDLIRWGGPMRSTDRTLESRVWKNYYLSKEILSFKNEIVTKKQNLKNMYNIRQMAVQCIGALTNNPQDLNIYQTIMKVLSHFFNAYDKMEANYPIGLTKDEITEYNRYLNIPKNDRIRRIYLPNKFDSIICWLNGEGYFKSRNTSIKETLKFNREVVNGETYHNPFQNLASKKVTRNKYDDYDDFDYNYEAYEEEEEADEEKNKKLSEDENELHPSPADFSINSAATNKTLNIKLTKKNLEEEEEDDEEEEVVDKIFNDEDIIEMTRVSFDGTEIKENLPKKYITDVLEERFNDLFVVKNRENKKKPSELMISYLRAISDPLTQMISRFEDELQKDEVSFNERETREAGRYLQRMKIIGMTSTVASVRKEALEAAGCEIIIVEEAGELTESMLSCILPSTLKRLILIGDYQQLRPKVEHEMTGNPNNYDISLFEKLVVNAKDQNASCLYTLSVQRRMHPQISSLIRNVFYSTPEDGKITDSPSTNNLEKPYGIPYRVRFFMHNYSEDKTSTRSHVNKKEAKFCASLVPFFICRGYKPEDITIISLYKGQMFQIQREIETLFEQSKRSETAKLFNSFGGIKSPKQIKVVVLDNFQGEENKIIIVSLTRSDRPGFVKNRNRALVTLSRAREMLVVLGNEKVFGQNCKGGDDLWRRISTEASKLNPFAMSKDNQEGIAVDQCSIHKPHSGKKPSFLDSPDDILHYRFSFCKEKCKYKLPCGHQCQLVCHCHNSPPGEHEHDDYWCSYRCTRKCPNGHQCTSKCGICTHKGECPPCSVYIPHKFEACGHEADVKCYLVTSGKARCHAKCGKELKCGHTCGLQCGHKGKCDCKVEVKRRCENCNRMFKYLCGEENPKCENQCNHILDCGHTCTSKCFECAERGHHDTECHQNCTFVFPCGHRCDKKCDEKFPLHQHYVCKKLVNLNHSFMNNHNNSGVNKHECTSSISCNLRCEHFCPVCNKSCNRKCSEKCIKRCDCRCRNKCSACGKRCRALSGEKCAIFCEHHKELGDEPPQSKGLLYVFHDNHFLPLDEAEKRINEQFDSIVHGKGELPIPVRRLTCPCDDCKSKEPCILGSWLFDKYNKEIEKVLGKIRKSSDELIERNKNSKKEKAFDKIHWYVCEDCGELFFVKFDDVNNITVKCPSCGWQKGEMFE